MPKVTPTGSALLGPFDTIGVSKFQAEIPVEFERTFLPALTKLLQRPAWLYPMVKYCNRAPRRKRREAGHDKTGDHRLGTVDYTWAVRMVCEEKGIAYVLTERPLGAPELSAIHPLGKMPVLRHGDVELFESKAIVTWLDRSFPGPSVFLPIRASPR